MRREASPKGLLITATASDASAKLSNFSSIRRLLAYRRVLSGFGVARLHLAAAVACSTLQTLTNERVELCDKS